MNNIKLRTIAYNTYTLNPIKVVKYGYSIFFLRTLDMIFFLFEQFDKIQLLKNLHNLKRFYIMEPWILISNTRSSHKTKKKKKNPTLATFDGSIQLM